MESVVAAVVVVLFFCKLVDCIFGLGQLSTEGIKMVPELFIIYIIA